jgi:hypothetical protein
MPGGRAVGSRPGCDAAAVKALGPLLFGGHGRSLVVDARAGGLAAAAVAIAIRAPLVVVVVCAAAVTALLRALS